MEQKMFQIGLERNDKMFLGTRTLAMSLIYGFTYNQDVF